MAYRERHVLIHRKRCICQRCRWRLGKAQVEGVAGGAIDIAKQPDPRALVRIERAAVDRGIGIGSAGAASRGHRHEASNVTGVESVISREGDVVGRVV